jgi:hypothetical protein
MAIRRGLARNGQSVETHELLSRTPPLKGCPHVSGSEPGELMGGVVMRWLAATLILGACVAGAALAQNPPIDGRFMPQWDQMPGPHDFAGNYPRSALSNNIPGIVHLCCTPREDRRLDCRVGFEWPESRRFGEASLTIARRFRMSHESYAAYQADPNAWLQVPITWNTTQPPENYDEIARRIREGTRNLCNPNRESSPTTE